MTRELDRLSWQTVLKTVLIAVLAGFLCAPSLALDTQTPAGSSEPQNLPLLTGHISDADYVLGPGDVISVNDAVMGEQGGPRVLDDGSVNLNLVGKVFIGGLTVEQARDVITQAFSEYYVHPAISVTVTYTRPIRVYVNGAVVHAGVYESGKAMNADIPGAGGPGVSIGTYSYYEMKLTDALLYAGGLQFNADVSNIVVKRTLPQKSEIHVNLWDILKGDVMQDFSLRDGDVVDVPEIPKEKLVMNADWRDLQSMNISGGTYRITVTGSVLKPGSYDVKNADNVLTAIAQAGGFGENANKNRVYILRKNSEGQVFAQTVNLANATILRKKPLDDVAQLLPGDIVVVEDSKLKIFAKGAADFGKYAGTAAVYSIINQEVNKHLNK